MRFFNSKWKEAFYWIFENVNSWLHLKTLHWNTYACVLVMNLLVWQLDELSVAWWVTEKGMNIQVQCDYCTRFFYLFLVFLCFWKPIWYRALRMSCMAWCMISVQFVFHGEILISRPMILCWSNLKTVVSLWKRVKCFSSTLRRENFKTHYKMFD